MFPVSSHTAEKVQNDINVILNAIAQWLAKVKLEWPQTQQNGELPPVQWNAELVRDPVLDLVALPDRQALPSHNLDLLPGKDFWLLTPVQLQIGTTTIAGLLPEVREQLNQLPPERIAALRAAIEQPTGTHGSGETLEIQINDATVLRRNEQGQMAVNELQPGLEKELLQVKAVKDVEAETAISPEYPSDYLKYPRIELRPVAEVEALTGQTLSDSSSIHQQVIQRAPSVLVTVDDQGQIKPGSYLREPVEATEDQVAAVVESDRQQALTPEAIAIVNTLQTHFRETGSEELICVNYTFKSEGDRLLVVPHDDSEPVTVIQDNHIHPALESDQYQALIQRFTDVYDQIQGCPNAENYDHSDEYELA